MNFQQKILIIEDDPGLGVTLQNILTLHKYDVCFANNGASGIQKAFEYSPNLILCDINMVPLDGYQVYKVLEESNILNRIPFIFLTGSSELQDIRYGMSLGADDYIVKPFSNYDLIKTIEKRLEKFKAIREEANREFDRLFELSPEGIFIFDGKVVFKANPAFKKLFKIVNCDPMGLSVESLFHAESIQNIRNHIPKHRPNNNEIFNDIVQVKNDGDDLKSMRLVVSVFEKYSKYTLYIGLFSPAMDTVGKPETQYAKEVYNLLKHENIKVSDALGEKITKIFRQKQLTLKNHNTFFTERENQVLCLSMEGMPIKNIADKLSISDRTVEKHRTKLMEKSGANNMIEVIIFALRNSLVEI
jgi:DNA-binding NarL/FixJ family response regulator